MRRFFLRREYFSKPGVSLEVRANLIPSEPLYLRRSVLVSYISITKETLFNVYAACHGRQLANWIMKEEEIPSLFFVTFGFGAGQFLFGIELIILGFACALILHQHLPVALEITLLIGTFSVLYGPATTNSYFTPFNRKTLLNSFGFDGDEIPSLRNMSVSLNIFNIIRLLFSELFNILKTSQPTWSSNAQKLQTFHAIVIGVHVALWSLIFYIAYRCIVFGIRRHLCEICKAADPKLNPDISIISFGCDDPQSSVADQTKNLIQKYLRKPVIWWPLEPPQRLLLPDTARITRECVRLTCCLVTIGLC